MLNIDLQTHSSEDLQRFDHMMVEGVIKIADLPSLAIWIWQEVLKELANRELVTLVSGSFDDVGNALILRKPNSSLT